MLSGLHNDIRSEFPNHYEKVYSDVKEILCEFVGDRKQDKKRESQVAGKANVLIFPNIESCNIGTKFVQMVSDSRIYGPIIQGFRLPVCDCSRSDTEEILYNNMICTCVLAEYKQKKA